MIQPTSLVIPWYLEIFNVCVSGCTSVNSQIANIIILVGGLEHFSFFHMLEIMIPTDFHIFQRVETC